jgi:hypothetical protein
VLPPGPEIVVVDRNAKLQDVHTRERLPGRERLILMRRDTPSPSRPTLPFVDCYDGRVLTLDELYGRILS